MKKSIGALAAITMAHAMSHSTNKPKSVDEVIAELPITNPGYTIPDISVDKPIVSKHSYAHTLPKDEWKHRKARRKLSKNSRRANRR